MAQEQQGFFEVEISDEFVEGLDEVTYSQLLVILRDNFVN